jgi:hypothetical protein
MRQWNLKVYTYVQTNFVFYRVQYSTWEVSFFNFIDGVFESRTDNISYSIVLQLRLASATLCHLLIINTIECWRANDMCKRTTFTSFNTGIQTSFNDNDWTACLWKWILHWIFLNQFQLLFHYRSCLPEVVYLETTLWCNLAISIRT